MTTVDNLLLIFLGLFLTVGPFIVALFTNHKRKILILILGILIGWTIIGCIALTIYAFSGSRFLPTKKQLNKMKNKTGETGDTKLIKCKVCNKKIAKDASVCPGCGTQTTAYFTKEIINTVSTVIVIGVACYILQDEITLLFNKLMKIRVIVF